MILISIKSEVVQDKRQFKTDRAALIFLRRIERLHTSHRMAIVGRRPVRKDYPNKWWGKSHWQEACKKYNAALGNHIRLKVEIINTKYNQLDFHTQLKQA